MAVFQHKYDGICPSGAIITFAVETLDQAHGRPVACVLMNAAEVAIFHHELVYSTNALPADDVAVLTDPKDFQIDKQRKLWLMTYPQLSEILAVSGGRLKKDLSLLLHLGCGEYTWDIVKACHDLWKWAWDEEVGKEDAIVRVYTISNLKESIYCDASASRLSTIGLTRPPLVRRQPNDFSAAIAQLQQEDDAHEELRKSIQKPQQPPKQTNRAVVFTSKNKLLEAYELHNCEPTGYYVQLSGDMTGLDLSEGLEVLLQREFDVKTLLVEPNVGTIGTVRNLGTVLVFPVRQGFFFDRRLSQVVLRQDMHMSRAEVRYACRVAVSPSDSGISRVVSLFTKTDFDKLPPAPTDPLAFTGDFSAILLHFCDHSYFDGDKTPPIRLPKDEKMTEEYLRRLELKGLTERRGGPLTDLGRTTAWWHHNGRIRNLNVANLLAIASATQGARASALIQIAAVLYHPGSSLMSPIASLLKFQIPEGRSAEFYSLLAKKKVFGFAGSYLERGPIWLAIALWVRHSQHMTPEELAWAKDFSMCNGMLQISPKTLSIIERNWVAMRQSYNLGGAQIDDDPLINEEDFLFLEECIVRVWMHNLVQVGMADSEQDVFACDLTSGAFIARPAGDPVRWAWLAQEVESEPPEGEPNNGVFAVYTVLHRLTGPDGRIQYVPEDLTFVSTRAVRRVIRDVATSKRWEGFRLPDEHDLLRTKYPIWFEADEEHLGDP